MLSTRCHWNDVHHSNRARGLAELDWGIDSSLSTVGLLLGCMWDEGLVHG